MVEIPTWPEQVTRSVLDGPGERRAKRALTAVLMILLVSGALATRTHRAFGHRPVLRRVPVDARFYVDPNDEAEQWVRGHQEDPRAATIARNIVEQPAAGWFNTYDPGKIADEVSRVVTSAARQGSIPVLVAYAIPHRDCGGPSSGGTPDIASYRQWIDNFASGLGSGPAWVVLEPDALAEAGCLSQAQRQERFQALAYAARRLRQGGPAVRVYYDAGHSRWQRAATMATRLRMAGADRYADGIALNVSNFNPTKAEVSYGRAILGALGNSSLRLIIDTSRNGDGPIHGYCDPPGPALGVPPTANTGNPWVDAFLWIKPPGEADGCVAGPGTFLPAYAYHLATAGTGARR
jgi:endoglucanase